MPQNNPQPSLFDAIISNPPYQQQDFDGSISATPIYHRFLDGAFPLADSVIMVHPAKFLFHNGKTPKIWNNKMLHSEHFSVVEFWRTSKELFPTVQVGGGVVVSLQQKHITTPPIMTFVPQTEMRSVLQKVQHETPLSNIVSNRALYKFSDLAAEDFPQICTPNNKSLKILSNAFESIPEVFSDDGELQVFGLESRKRTSYQIRREYVVENEHLQSFNVVVPKAFGGTRFGETFPPILLAHPDVLHTETFLSIGCFNTETEAKYARKYLHTKFARALLGTLKGSHNLSREKFRNVPLQDFSSESDISWDQSVMDIDEQLFEKYQLDASERQFILNNVLEMPYSHSDWH